MLSRQNQLVYEHAQALASFGFVPILLQGLIFHPDETTGKLLAKCTCNRSVSCGTPGKHPVLGWKQAAMDTPTEGMNTLMNLLRRARDYQDFNLGIRTGPESNCFVVDIDKKNAGFENFAEFLKTHQINDHVHYRTLEADTGGGGKHYFFKYPRSVEKIPSSANHRAFNFEQNIKDKEQCGVDIRGYGGIAVVYPSIHKSGQLYRWTTGPDQFRDAPDVFVRAVEIRNNSTERTLYHTPDDAELVAFADRLRRSKQGDNGLLGRYMAEALEGKAILLEGGAHDVYKKMMYRIAGEYPHADPALLIEHFRVSIEQRMELKPDSSVTLEDVYQCADSALKKRREEKTHWENQLTKTDKGKIVSCSHNVSLVLKNAPEWDDVFAMNIREERPTLLKALPGRIYGNPELNRYPRAMIDADEVHVIERLGLRFDVPIRQDHVNQALTLLFQDRAIDPFLEYLKHLPPWDGVPRVDTWLVACAGAANTAYEHAVSGKWLLQVVNRTLNPGCQADYTLILEGGQGKKKSSLLAALMPDRRLFMDDLSVISAQHNKDNILKLHGPAIIELAELTSITRGDIEAVKAFLTCRSDRFRVPFGRYTNDHPRRCCFAGSTNRDDYFKDDTGNRRFWPVVVGSIDLSLLIANRDRLWSEALHRLRYGEMPYLDENAEKMAIEEQENRMETDSWSELVEKWLETREKMIFSHTKINLTISKAERRGFGNNGNTPIGAYGNNGNTTFSVGNTGNTQDDILSFIWLDDFMRDAEKMPWTDDLIHQYGELEYFSLSPIYESMNLDASRRTSATDRRLSKILKSLGYVNFRLGNGKTGKQWRWKRIF